MKPTEGSMVAVALVDIEMILGRHQLSMVAASMASERDERARERNMIYSRRVDDDCFLSSCHVFFPRARNLGSGCSITRNSRYFKQRRNTVLESPLESPHGKVALSPSFNIEPHCVSFVPVAVRSSPPSFRRRLFWCDHRRARRWWRSGTDCYHFLRDAHFLCR